MQYANLPYCDSSNSYVIMTCYIIPQRGNHTPGMASELYMQWLTDYHKQCTYTLCTWCRVCLWQSKGAVVPSRRT